MHRVVVLAIAILILVCAGRASADVDIDELDARSAADDLYVGGRPPTPAPSLPAQLIHERGRLETERDGKRTLAIGMLRDLLASGPGSETEADALFKLAELVWQDSQREFLVRMDGFARELEACRRATCARPPVEPRIDLRESETLYRKLLAGHPELARADLVTYLIGFAAHEDGRGAEALALFERVVADHPASPVAGDAWMMIGEHHFTAERWVQARDAYAAVLARPDAPTYDLALFKTAWTEWKLGELEPAALRFKRMLDLCPYASQRRTRLCDESVDGLVAIFTEDRRYTAADVHGFFESVGGSRYATDVLIKVGESYTGQSEYERAADVYQFLIAQDPGAVRAAGFQRAIVDGWSAALDGERAQAAVGVLLDRYGPRSEWAAHATRTARERDAVARSLAETEQLVRVTARNLHADAQARERADRCKVAAAGVALAAGVRRCSTKVTPLFTAAAAAYERYLAAFGADRAAPDAVEIRYLRAQILYLKLGELEAAGDELMVVARSAPVGAFHKPALETAMDAYERARPPTPGGELLPVDRKFGAALDLYASLFPGKDVAGLLYRNGRMFFDHAMFDEAVKRWSVLVTKYPRSPDTAAAADGILAASTSGEDWAGLETWARKFRTLDAYASVTEQDRLNRVIAESIGKLGDRYADAGRHELAAQTFLRLRDEFPRHPSAPEKMMNAGVMYEKAKRHERAADVYLQIADAYPRWGKADRAAFAAGRVYEQVARFDRAAAAYELVVAKFPRSPTRADAIYNAGRLRQALGQQAKAIAHYRRYVREFRARPDAIDVAFDIGVVLEAAGNDGEAERELRAYTKIYASTGRRMIEAHVRAGRAAFRLGQGERAADSFDDALRLHRRATGAELAAGTVWAAEARYYQGELVFREYERLQLAVAPAALARTLKRKLQLLADAKQLYDSIATFNEPRWVIAALYRTGSIYDHFADALVAAPLPSGLTPAQRTAYQAQLDATVIEVQGLALEQFVAGFTAAHKLGLYDANTVKIHKALQRLDPTGYPPEHEARAGVRIGDRPLAPELVDDARR